MVLNDLVQVLSKFGFSNIENVKRQPAIEAQAKAATDKVHKTFLAGTLFVFKITAIIRNDKKKVLSCEVCRQMTNTLVKLHRTSKDSCPDCMAKELGETRVFAANVEATPGVVFSGVDLGNGKSKTFINGKEVKGKKIEKIAATK